MQQKQHTKESLMEDLARAGVDPKGTLWLHISLKSVGDIEGGGDTLVDALMEYMKDGLLVMPTHTWADVHLKQPYYNVKETPSCIGILPDLFRKRDNVYRGVHPTHSVAAFGKEAEQFVQGQEVFPTPCHPDSNYGDLLRREAHVLLIGVNYARNTLVHCIEEIVDVPKRLEPLAHELFSIDYDGTIHATPQNRHIGAISENYPRMEQEMYDREKMTDVYIGSAKTMSFNAKDLKDVTLELLAEDLHRFDNIE